MFPVAAILLMASCATPEPDLPEIRPGPRVSAPTPAESGDVARPPVETPPLTEAREGPVRLTVGHAVLLAIARNRALRVERLNPAIVRTFEEQERAVFEPVLLAEAAAGREVSERAGGETVREDEVTGGVGVSETLPTGTDVTVGTTIERTTGTNTSERYATGASLTVTQALLRGRGLEVNLASLRQARLDTRFSEYELRGFAEALVAAVETTYWDYVLADREVAIFEESLKLAGQQLEETGQRVRVGDVAETELAAAQAEVALRREALINARSRVATLRVRLLRLIHPQLTAWGETKLVPQSEPRAPEADVEPMGDHVAVAMRMRPELNQARLLIRRGELELVKTRNGLLPQMDLFVRLGKTGYAGSFAGSVGDIPEDGYEVFAGVTFEYPLTNRDARARHRRAALTRRQYGEALRNLEDLVREDVAAAHIEVRRAAEQVGATRATRRFQEEKFRAETAKFRVGKSTSLLVATAQRDLVASQVAEVEAVINHLKALVELYRLEGSLLERRGIEAPGREPASAGGSVPGR
jgi:outer membrane protein TolC